MVTTDFAQHPGHLQHAQTHWHTPHAATQRGQHLKVLEAERELLDARPWDEPAQEEYTGKSRRRSDRIGKQVGHIGKDAGASVRKRLGRIVAIRQALRNSRSPNARPDRSCAPERQHFPRIGAYRRDLIAEKSVTPGRERQGRRGLARALGSHEHNAAFPDLNRGRMKEQHIALKTQDPVDGKIRDERLPDLLSIHDREIPIHRDQRVKRLLAQRYCLPTRGSRRSGDVVSIGEKSPAELDGVQIFGIVEGYSRHIRLVERTDNTSNAKGAMTAPLRINNTFRIDLSETKVQRLVVGVQLEPTIPEPVPADV